MMIALLIVIYVLKIIAASLDSDKNPNTSDKKMGRMMLALLWPLLALAKVFIWNTWVSHWINWPQFTTIEQYLVTMFFL